MKIIKIDEMTYEVDGAQVWYTDGVARCVECSGPLVAMSRSCKHARAVKRLTMRGADLFKRDPGKHPDFVIFDDIHELPA